jgi:hypothetical protein
MGTKDRGRWTRQLLFSAAVVTLVATACSGTPPTGPSTPTPTPATTPPPCAAGLASFTANPSTIMEGDAFTLSWSAPCGFVSLALRGQSPFKTLLSSAGSYQVQSGQPGYPTAYGATAYEAKNGDTATPLNTTVTMNPKPTPAPTPRPTPTDTGANEPASAANVASFGTVAWNNTAGALHSDSQYAYTNALGGCTTPWDASVRLVRGGAVAGSDYAHHNNIPMSDAWMYYGGSADLWGLSLTADDVNSSSFGVAVAYECRLQSQSNYLQLTGFGFSVPHGATINGVSVAVEVVGYNPGSLSTYASVNTVTINVNYTP